MVERKEKETAVWAAPSFDCVYVRNTADDFFHGYLFQIGEYNAVRCIEVQEIGTLDWEEEAAARDRALVVFLPAGIYEEEFELLPERLREGTVLHKGEDYVIQIS